MHILKVMSNPPNTIERREKLQGKGAAAGKSIQARHTRNGHRAEQWSPESERERNTKRPGTGA
jgi:hypothetical protein